MKVCLARFTLSLLAILAFTQLSCVAWTAHADPSSGLPSVEQAVDAAATGTATISVTPPAGSAPTHFEVYYVGGSCGGGAGNGYLLLGNINNIGNGTFYEVFGNDTARGTQLYFNFGEDHLYMPYSAVTGGITATMSCPSTVTATVDLGYIFR